MNKLSRDRLEGVPPDLVRVVERAIQITTQGLLVKEKACARVSAFSGYINELRIAHVQRSDGWIETTWNNMSDPGASALAGAEEQEGGEPPPLAALVWLSA